jgi:hypothetical protein
VDPPQAAEQRKIARTSLKKAEGGPK